jgi:hypothetical protein
LIALYLLRIGEIKNREEIDKFIIDLANSKNHSILGAVQILLLRDKMMKDGFRFEPKVQLVYELAALFVLTHQIAEHREALKNIDFNMNPLGSLLYIADNIQGWGRFSLKQNKMIDACPSVNVEIDVANNISVAFERKKYQKEKLFEDKLEHMPFVIKSKFN